MLFVTNYSKVFIGFDEITVGTDWEIVNLILFDDMNVKSDSLIIELTNY